MLAWRRPRPSGWPTLDVSDDALAALAAERDAAAAGSPRWPRELSARPARRGRAVRRGRHRELAGLAMPRAASRSTCTRSRRASGPSIELAGERSAVGPDGVDEVELLLRPHPGAPPLPVQRGASGGELSRVMLAIEVVFAGADPVPTMVFDEVDAGVGGRAAVEVGRRLARLAARPPGRRGHPPGPGRGVRRRATRGGQEPTPTAAVVTRSDVRRARRRRPGARSWPGCWPALDDTELGRAHAGELLAAARADRARPSRNRSARCRSGSFRSASGA